MSIRLRVVLTATKRWEARLDHTRLALTHFAVHGRGKYIPSGCMGQSGAGNHESKSYRRHPCRWTSANQKERRGTFSIIAAAMVPCPCPSAMLRVLSVIPMSSANWKKSCRDCCRAQAETGMILHDIHSWKNHQICAVFLAHDHRLFIHSILFADHFVITAISVCHQAFEFSPPSLVKSMLSSSSRYM